MSLCIINEMLGKSDKGDQTILRIFIPMRALARLRIGACAKRRRFALWKPKQNTRVQGRSPGKIFVFGFGFGAIS